MQVDWRKKFSWLPRRCTISDRLIWFRYGYFSITYYSHDWYYEVDWHDANEHILWELRNRKESE